MKAGAITEGGIVVERQGNVPHYGGQLGLAALLCMLSVTGCVAFSGTASSSGFLPGLMPSSFQQNAPVVATEASLVRGPAATFIVRFNDEPELDAVCRNFRRDQAGTREAYQRWAAQYPQLQGLTLVSASYSGELILGLPQDDPAGRTPRQVIAALETMENLAYADIDSMARASE